jgi:hypothetical protein
VTGTDPAALLAGAVRVDQASDDWRAQVRREAHQLVDDIDRLVDGADCTCPTPAGLCRDDCAHCTALPDDAPCPADVDDQGDDDAATWTPVDEVTELTPALARAVLEPPAPTSTLLTVPPALDHPGWRSRHDPASRAFAVVDRLAGRATLRDVRLPATPVLNQGKEGACVGFGVADAVNVLRILAGAAGVNRQLLDDAGALDLYHQAQRVDDVPGENYTGTSVLAGMKAGQADGYFGGYLWDFGTSAIAQTLLQLHTPVVIGVPWYDAMYDTGPGGLVRVGGKLVGGHCLCIVGLLMKGPQGQAGPFFVWRNSWGEDYGDHGDGYVHHRDLTALLARQGEAAVPTMKAQR